MIDHRLVTKDDIRHVVYRMWDRGADEISLFPIGQDREAIIEHFVTMAKEHGYAFYYEGEPVAVFGASKTNGIYYTWFMATNQFSEIGKAATLWLRKFTRDQVAAHPGEELQLHSAVDHPEADRWFELLGFHFIEGEGIFRAYAYKPRK